MQHSVAYTIVFAGIVCVVCAVLVSSSAVSFSELQQANAALDKRKNVLLAAGLAQPSEKLDAAQIQERFQVVEPVVIDMQSGQPVAEIDAASFNQRKARNDPASSRPAPGQQLAYQPSTQSGRGLPDPQRLQGAADGRAAH